MDITDLPDWWIRHVALERLNCRSFFTSDNWIEYDLDLDDEHLKTVAAAEVLITGPYSVLDGVDPVSVTSRMTRGLGGSYFEPLEEDMLSEGKLSSDSFAQPGNPSRPLIRLLLFRLISMFDTVTIFTSGRWLSFAMVS